MQLPHPGEIESANVLIILFTLMGMAYTAALALEKFGESREVRTAAAALAGVAVIVAGAVLLIDATARAIQRPR